MTKQAVIIDYSRDADKDLDNFAEAVYKALNPNPNFVWDTKVMPLFKTNTDNYRTMLQAAQNGTSTDVLAKNLAKTTLTDQMREIAMEVNKQAGDDLIKLQSSGFILARGKSKVGTLPKPTGFKVSTGANSGDLLMNVDANMDTTTYNFYTAPVPAPANINDWRLTPSTTHRKNISGFTPGTQYAVRCAYLGTDPTLVFSDTVQIYAQ
jgi:hypothetical protein